MNPPANHAAPMKIGQFLSSYAQNLKSDYDFMEFELQGKLVEKSGVPFGRWLYWYLVDGNDKITVQIDTRWKSFLGRRVQICAYPKRRLLQKNQMGDKVEVYIEALKLHPLEEPEEVPPIIDRFAEASATRRESWPKTERSLVEAIVGGRRPKIVMIVGSTSSIDQDVFASLGALASEYDFERVTASMENPDAIAEKLLSMGPETDLAAIVRGGGDTIPSLDNETLFQAMLDCPIPVVVALGHATDNPDIQRMASRHFDTPTLLGTWLLEKVQQARQIIADASKGMRDEKTELEKQLEVERNNMAHLRRKQEEMQENFAKLNEQIARQNNELAEAKAKLAQREGAQEQKYQSFNETLEKLNEQIARQNSELAEARVKLAQRDGSQEQNDQVLRLQQANLKAQNAIRSKQDKALVVWQITAIGFAVLLLLLLATVAVLRSQ
jgi:hypothetical protein